MFDEDATKRRRWHTAGDDALGLPPYRRGDQHHMIQVRFLAEPSSHFITNHAGQADIQQDRVRSLLLRRL